MFVNISDEEVCTNIQQKSVTTNQSVNCDYLTNDGGYEFLGTGEDNGSNAVQQVVQDENLESVSNHDSQICSTYTDVSAEDQMILHNAEALEKKLFFVLYGQKASSIVAHNVDSAEDLVVPEGSSNNSPLRPRSAMSDKSEHSDNSSIHSNFSDETMLSQRSGSPDNSSAHNNFSDEMTLSHRNGSPDKTLANRSFSDIASHSTEPQKNCDNLENQFNGKFIMINNFISCHSYFD